MSESQTLLPDRRRFLRRASDAELAALRTADPEQKQAWADIALAWIQLAENTPPHLVRPS
jgi:hypothetical protein